MIRLNFPLYRGIEKSQAACSFRWIVVAESIVRWFVVREKHCWMAADSTDMLKRIR
jgi:hypothetical protein